jgi:hypothetical protein
MDPQKWFSEQLHTGGNAFIWSAKQVPEERRNIAPPMPDGLGEWTALRHVYHMWNYEHNIALPAMRLWLGGPPHPQEHLDAWANEDADWGKHSYDKTLEMFRQVRDEQITMLQQFSETAWSEARKIDFWGDVTLHWVVSKTFQHTMEHGCTLMQLALFWDVALAQQQSQSDAQ